DSARYPNRQQADEALCQAGASAVPLLRHELSVSKSPEARRRIETILLRIDHHILTREQRRSVRVMEVLEYMGTKEVMHFVEQLAQGYSKDYITYEAKATCARLLTRFTTSR